MANNPIEFKLEIDLGNAGMCTPEDVGEALVKLGNRLRDGARGIGRIIDNNGNHVGGWCFVEEEDEED